MLIRRSTAFVASVFALVLMTAASALATSGPSYPPGVGGNDTGVQGSTVGNGVIGNSGGGLPRTGFETGLLVGAAALLVFGVALLVLSRRRGHA